MPLWMNRRILQERRCRRSRRTARPGGPSPGPAAGREAMLASAIAFSSFHFLVRCVFTAKPAEFVPLQPVRFVFLVFHGRIVPPLTKRAGHRDDFAHDRLL